MLFFSDKPLTKVMLAGIYALGIIGILEAVYQNEGGGQIDITGTVDFTDPDGDVISATVKVFDSGDQEVSSETITIANVDGLTSGTIQGLFTANTSVVDNFEVQVFITDANSLRSNILATSASTSMIRGFPNRPSLPLKYMIPRPIPGRLGRRCLLRYRARWLQLPTVKFTPSGERLYCRLTTYWSLIPVPCPGDLKLICQISVAVRR